MAICPSCNTEKDESEFYIHKNRSTGRSAWCKTCERIKRNKYRKNNPDKVRNNNYKSMYSISLEDYNKMFIEQAGCCKICNTHQNNLIKKLAVDHCHLTNKIRGLLCSNCNTALGLMNDDTDLLKIAIKYLEKNK